MRLFAGLFMAALASCTVASGTSANRMDSPPRKVVIGTTMKHFVGPLPQRIATATAMIDAVAAESARKYPGTPLDLVVLPENALEAVDQGTAAERSVVLEGPILETFAAKARQHRTNIVLPLMLRERPAGAKEDIFSNAAVVISREGKVIGTYRKVFPVGTAEYLEGGVMPGGEFPVIACDFGRIGIQICWDMSYEDGFRALGKRGAEIVVIPSASPQTVRPASNAQRFGYYVATATPRNNATIFSPIGTVLAKTTTEAVLVQQLDLSYAVLHWSRTLENGAAFTKAFGDRAGFIYSEREDTGVFWSNDPKTTVGEMCRQLKAVDMATQVEAARRAGEMRRPAVAVP